jgi:KaiC/GvpD/RAD55 family RecA-like ATPase
VVWLFRRLYELRAEETAKGGARVVVVGPTCAGKTTFITHFLKHMARR